MDAKKRLMCGLRRLNRIIRSAKTYKIWDLLVKAKIRAEQKHADDEFRRRSKILKKAPMNQSERNEKNLLMLHVKIDKMADVIQNQKSEIFFLKKSIVGKLNKLLDAHKITYEDSTIMTIPPNLKVDQLNPNPIIVAEKGKI